MSDIIKLCKKFKIRCSRFFFFFGCQEGFMQSISLSPILFSIYVKDFEIELKKNEYISWNKRYCLISISVYVRVRHWTFLLKNRPRFIKYVRLLMEIHIQVKAEVGVEKKAVEKKAFVVFRKSKRLKKNTVESMTRSVLILLKIINILV